MVWKVNCKVKKYGIKERSYLCDGIKQIGEYHSLDQNTTTRSGENVLDFRRNLERIDREYDREGKVKDKSPAFCICM